MRKIVFLVMCVAMLGMVSSAGAVAVDTEFTNGTGDGKFYTSGNWTHYPIKNDFVHVGTAVNNNKTATADEYNNTNKDIRHLHVGHGGTGAVIINNGGRIRPYN
ncbi:MAG: hypothetical protein ACYTF1_17540, partial [Planctomycetota bacterium]